MQNTIYVKSRFETIIQVTRIVTIHYFEYDKDYTYHGENHDFWEMMYADRGSVWITSKDHKFLLKQGELVFHSPNQFHNICADGKHAANVFIVSFDTKSRAMGYFEDKIIKLQPALKGFIMQIIKEGRAAYDLPRFNPDMRELIPRKNAAIGAQQLVRLNLEQLLILLLRENQENGAHKQVFTSKSKYDDYLVSMVMAILEENIYGNITMSEISGRLNYGKTYLSSVFKKVSGDSIMNCFTKLKMKEAKFLLREKNFTIAEISAKLGYDTPQYFSKRFKQIAGMSPREYVNSVKTD